jgi:hypothetical protein
MGNALLKPQAQGCLLAQPSGQFLRILGEPGGSGYRRWRQPSGEWGGKVPVFMVERRFAEELEAASEVVDGINRINEEEGVRWLYSFLSSDRRKTYCLYEAPSPEAIRRAATRAGLPADVIVEVTDRLLPDGATAAI